MADEERKRDEDRSRDWDKRQDWDKDRDKDCLLYTSFCAHSRFLVFGEESARAGVGEILDFFERNREPRLTAHLLVVKGMTAADFLKSEYELVPLPPEGGRGMIQNATNRLGTVVDVNINDFLICLLYTSRCV